MGLFSRGQQQPAMPQNIVDIMDFFGRSEFDPQGMSEEEARYKGTIEPMLFSLAQADPEMFLTELAQAVLPVGGWAAYGAEHLARSLLDSSVFQHPSYIALMDASLNFLRTSGVPPTRLNTYEWMHWVASGGTSDTWFLQRPTSAPGE